MKDFGKVYIGMGEKFGIKFPLETEMPKIVGELKCRRTNETLNSSEVFKPIKELTKLSIVQVEGNAQHFSFLGKDGSFWGIGARVQSRGPEKIKLRKIGTSEFKGKIVKMIAGKHQRWILTSDGNVHFQGENKEAVAGYQN